jgi:hypothetical protein
VKEITVDEIRIPPAGDPFTSAPAHPPTEEATPHGCIDGVVYIGQMEIGEDGEEVEVFEAVPCRWCSR